MLSRITEKKSTRNIGPVASIYIPFPWKCDFGTHNVSLYDFYSCQMTQWRGSDAFWRVNSGETPTNNTGPSLDILVDHGGLSIHIS